MNFSTVFDGFVRPINNMGHIQQNSCKFASDGRSIGRSVAENSSARPVGSNLAAAFAPIAASGCEIVIGEGGFEDRGCPERTLPTRSVFEEKTMRRSFLLTVFAAMAAILGACQAGANNKPASVTPTATPVVVASPATTASPSSTASPSKDEKKPETKASPATSPTARSTATPRKK